MRHDPINKARKSYAYNYEKSNSFVLDMLSFPGTPCYSPNRHTTNLPCRLPPR